MGHVVLHRRIAVYIKSLRLIRRFGTPPRSLDIISDKIYHEVAT